MSTALICSIAAAGACAAPEADTAGDSIVPPPAYRMAAANEGVPATVLFSVALQESGWLIRGRIRPWPWTLNIAGEAKRFSGRAQACGGLRNALRTVAPTRIDVGLGQINVGYHGHRVDDPCALLDPYLNLALTARILREHYSPDTDWLTAIGRYHRPAGGAPAEKYRRSVQRHHLRVFGAYGVLQ